MEVILNINDLKYKNLFENLSIYIEKDKITTISGANNCGKTTLLRILTRQVKTENNIVLHGKNINEYKFEDHIRYIRCRYFGTIMVCYILTCIDVAHIFISDKCS